jgi:hypothetical protein
MGGTVSGIIIASIPAFIGFFCRFFTPFLMRSSSYLLCVGLKKAANMLK